MRSTGFTLIELMVSVGIIMVTLGGMIANYNGYNNRQTLKQTALTLKNNLRFAQAKALSGEKPTSNCTELIGWTISFTSGTYTLQAQCTPQGSQGALVSVVLPTGVVFSPVPSTITFRVLSRGTGLASVAPLSLVGFDQTYNLEVSPGGDISDGGVQ